MAVQDIGLSVYLVCFPIISASGTEASSQNGHAPHLKVPASATSDSTDSAIGTSTGMFIPGLSPLKEVESQMSKFG